MIFLILLIVFSDFGASHVWPPPKIGFNRIRPSSSEENRDRPMIWRSPTGNYHHYNTLPNDELAVKGAEVLEIMADELGGNHPIFNRLPDAEQKREKILDPSKGLQFNEEEDQKHNGKGIHVDQQTLHEIKELLQYFHRDNLSYKDAKEEKSEIPEVIDEEMVEEKPSLLRRFLDQLF